MLERLTILLAEDNPDDVVLLKRALNRAHLANPLQVVSNGEQAIAYLRGDGRYSDREKYPHPFLLLLDLSMPRADGFEVLSWLRAHDNEHDIHGVIPVVLTYSADAFVMERAYNLGAVSYLVKTPKYEDLIALIQRLGCRWMILDNSKNGDGARSEFDSWAEEDLAHEIEAEDGGGVSTKPG